MRSTSAPLLLIPGPTPVPQRVLEALARPTESHSSSVTASALQRLQEGVTQAVGGQSSAGPAPMVLVLGGSGTLALECGIVNLVAPGEKLLVVSHGLFGERYAAVGRAIGADVEVVECPWGEQVPPEQVEAALISSKAKVMTATHVDTATGVVSPFRDYARIADHLGVTMVLDAVATVGGMSVDMAENRIDVVVTASQKALGMPPGLAILAVSQRALETRRRLSGCRSYFLDWLNWEATMGDSAGRYFATIPTNMIIAGKAAVDIAIEEGWENRFRRHRRMARSARRGLRAIGLNPLAQDAVLGATVTATGVPEGVTPSDLRLEVAKDGVAIAGAIGKWAPLGVRFGHMGAVDLPDLLQGVAAVEAALARLGAPVERGAGVAELVAGWGDELPD
ncbi:MAG: pyridoxal-phosphate-dependent aminotransferase family protein [Candidatus Dormibacteria bacterium]